MLEVNIKTTNRFAFLENDDEELEAQQVRIAKTVVSKRAGKDKRTLIVEKKVESKSFSGSNQVTKNVHFNDTINAKERPRQDNKAGRNDYQRQDNASYRSSTNNERDRQGPPVFVQNQNNQADTIVTSKDGDENAENDSNKLEVDENAQVLEQPLRMLSLEEFKAMTKVEQPKFDIRKPGEGADKKLYQKLIPIKKPKAALKPEQDNTEKEKTHKRREKALDIPVIFVTQKRGGFSGNRGRDNNRSRNDNNRRVSNRESGDAEGGGATNFEGSRGGGSRSGGAPRRGGNFRGDGRFGGDGREQGSNYQSESFNIAPSSRGGRSFRGGHSQQPTVPPPAPVAVTDTVEGVMNW